MDIKDPTTHPVQLYLSAHIQLGEVLERLLVYTGRARLTVSTFSTGEEFLRRLHRIREKGMITHATLYCDHKAAEKTARIYPMLTAVYDEVKFCPNHSKVMIIEGTERTVVVMTSQNQTRGNRLENYTILKGGLIAPRLLRILNKLETFEPPWSKNNEIKSSNSSTI